MGMSQDNIQEIENNRKLIFDRYSYICVHCRDTAVVIHELVPRSLRPNDWWDVDNMVCLCAKCHDWAHNWGTAYSLRILMEDMKQWQKT